MLDQIQKNNLFFRQLLFLSILILLAVVMFRQLSFFVGSFLGAITLYIVFRNMRYRMVERRGWKPWIASLALVILSALVLCGLLFGVFQLIAVEIQNADTSDLVRKFNGLITGVNDILPFRIVPEDILHESSSLLTKIASSVMNTTYSFAINILLMLLILYFMLAHAEKMEKKIRQYNPLRGDSRKMMNEEVTNIIYSNAVGIPLVMLSQGLAAALIYWLFGMQNIVFWAFLTALCGLIPMVGTIIVSVPLGISMMINDHVWKGVLLMLCGLLVIANVDNLARIVLNKRISNIHPLIVIFGVMLGIPLFGFWGIIFGPLLISIFLLLVRIYYKEFKLIPPKDTDKTTAVEVAQSNDNV